MKKIFIPLITLFLIVLAACGSKAYVKGKLEVTVEHNKIAYNFTLVDANNDIDEEVYIYIRLYEVASNKEISSNSFTKKTYISREEKDNNKYNFINLKPETEYKIVIKTTYNNESHIIFENEYLTLEKPEEIVIDINTVEDFFNIKNNNKATYNLQTDLDFANIEQTTLNNNHLASFQGNFNGNGYTIKNYSLTKSMEYVGLFGKLEQSARVEDLIIENTTISVNSGSRRNVGTLFGSALSDNVTINNVEIINSQISVSLQSATNLHNIGILGGESRAKISNINIDSNSKLVVNATKIQSPNIGGVIGMSNVKNASLTEVVANGTIEVSIDQTNELDAEGEIKTNNSTINIDLTLSIGGIVGLGKYLNIENIISNTNITIKESIINFEKPEEPEKNTVYKNTVYIRIGGIAGTFSDTSIENAIYTGTIDIEEIEVVHEIDYIVNKRIEVGLVFGKFFASDSRVINVLVDGAVINNNNNIEFEIHEGTIVGFYDKTRFIFGEFNLFGYANLSFAPTEVNIRELTLNDLFTNDSWILENYNN